MDRRQVLIGGATGIGGLLVGGGIGSQMGSSGDDGGTTASGGGQDGGSGSSMGSVVDERKVLTATAKFDPLRPQIAKILAESFGEIGLNFPANPLRYEKNSDKVISVEPDYDMWLVRISSSPARIEPNFHTTNFYHSGSQHNQGWNWMGYENDDVDFMCELQSGELDKNKRQKIVYQLQDILKEESPASQLVHPYLLQFYRDDNVTFNGPFTPGEGLNSFWAKVNAEPGNRSEIREVWTSTVDRLNPIAITDVLDLWWARMIYSRLLRVNPDGVPEPYESEELNVISDTELEIVLNPDLKWHDGDSVTAEDVKFTYELYKRAKAPYYQGALKFLDRVEIADDYRVRFHLTEPTAGFVHSALAGVMLLKKEKWEKIEEESTSLLKYNLEEPLGSGPFKFDSWNRGGKFIISKNEDFVPEPPKVDKFVRLNADNLELALQKVSQDGADVVPYGVTPQIFSRAKEESNIETQRAMSVGYYGLFFNCDRQPFTDPQFREAIQYAIPRQRIVDEVFNGMGELGTSIISPGNEYWNNPNISPYPHDPDKAKALLKDAGYSWDADGNLRYPDGMVGVPSVEDVEIPVPE